MKKMPGIVLFFLFIMTAPLGSVTITSPMSGDTWYTGYYQTISWDSKRTPYEKVKIYLLSAETSEAIETWDLGEDKGSYRWNLLRSFPPGHYKIRIKIGMDLAESDPFEIKESFIRVTYPNEEMRVREPTTVRVTWESSEEIKAVRITKICNNRTAGSDVIKNLNHYDFVIDGSMTGSWLIKVANGNDFDHFSYTAPIMTLLPRPSIKINSPSTPTSFRIGDTISIKWEAVDFDKAVRVELWDWEKEQRLGIIKDITDSEIYSWDSFTLEGKPLDWELLTGERNHHERLPLCFIKVVALSIPNLSAKSSNFTFQAPLVQNIIEPYRPNQGDRWVMGQTQALGWQMKDARFAEEEMDIHLYQEETQTALIGKTKLEKRTFSYALPHGLDEGSRYRVAFIFPRFQTAAFSKYFIIQGDYCYGEKVRVQSITLDKEKYLFNEDIEVNADLENLSADPVSGTLRLYLQKNRNELGHFLGEMEIKMAPESKIELAPILIQADRLFNSPGKYSCILQPKIVPKNLAFITCSCSGRSFTIDASLQIPCKVELIDFSVDKPKYNMNEKLEFSFTLYNKSGHPFQGDIAVTGSSGFKDVEFYKGRDVSLEQSQKKQVTGSIPVRDIVDSAGRYELKLVGQFVSSDAIVESGKAKLRRGPKIDVLPQVSVHDLERVDLKIERFRFAEKSEFQGGEKGKVYISIKNNGNVVQKSFQIRSWSVVGEPQKTTGLTVFRPQELGNVSIKKSFSKSLQPGETSTEILEITFREKKSGSYTLYIEVTPTEPKTDAEPEDNRKFLPFGFKAVLQIKRGNQTSSSQPIPFYEDARDLPPES